MPNQLRPFLPLAAYAEFGIGDGDAPSPVPAGARDSWSIDGSLNQLKLRGPFRQEFGYVLVTAECMAVLSELLASEGPVLDAGCGSGYLAKELTRLNVPTFAVDQRDYTDAGTPGESQPVGYPIKQVYQLDAVGDAAAFVTAEIGAVLLAWPPCDKPFAERVAQAMIPGQLLVYQGEPAGGCTANDAFFEFMADARKWERLHNASSRLNAVHVTWDTLHDDWAVWRRLGE